MVFDWVDIVISIGIVQGVFLIFSLRSIKDRNVELNQSLILLLSITSFMLLGRLIYFQAPRGTFDRYALLFDTVIFLFGPITYNFTNKLLFIKGENSIKWKYHLIPAIIHLTIALFLLIAGQSYFVKLANEGYIAPYYLITELTAIMSNFAYIIACFMLISKFKEQEKNQLSFEQNPQYFIKYFLYGCLMLVIIWLLSVINFQFRISSFRIINYDMIWSVIPLLTYVVGYYLQKQPALFRIHHQVSPRKD